MINRQYISQHYIRGSGIEIGAFHNPFPVNQHMKVTYVDRYSYEHLAKWRDSDKTIQGKEITRVDVIDDGMFLEKFDSESQDFVLSSHHLEHCWSPLTTIRHHLRVLKTGGKVFYAIPDRRFTFDKNRDGTGGEDDSDTLLDLYNCTFPEFYIENVNRYAVHKLKQQLIDYYENVDKFDRAKSLHLLDSIKTTDELISKDIHWFCWDSFQLLSMLSNTPFSDAFDIELFSQAGHENFVVLRKL